MLHKVKSTYGDIARYFPELKARLSPSAHNKRLLLEMAERGEPRPKRLKNWRAATLAFAFFRYVKVGGQQYDPAFAKSIKRIAPHWFLSQSEATKQKKRKLLKMAERGDPRPTNRTHPSLADILKRHATPGQFGYDPAFSRKIRKLAPQWFANHETYAHRKKKLLDMAEKGMHKPTIRTRLACFLGDLTNKKSKAYEPAFHAKIKKLAPKWFAKEICEEKKQKLLALARKGIARPNARFHPLGLALHTYVFPKSRAYDPAFVKQLKKIAPNWFVRQQVLRANRKKQALLEMAGKKKPRPSRLNSQIYRYMSLDPKFAREIKRLAPHWFRKCSTK